jgi:hypothetical protein
MQQPRSRADALSAIPSPLPGVRATVTDQGLVRISHPAALKPWLKRLLPPSLSQPMRTLELDAMGTFVWNLMDGTSSVGELARCVSEHYACLPAEAEQAVALFMKQLGQRGIIALK